MREIISMIIGVAILAWMVVMTTNGILGGL